MIKTLRALKFLFIGPMILVLLVIINYMTSPGEWWVQWPALGIGIAWVISLIRVVTALVVAGGLAGLIAYVKKNSSTSQGA
jgi:hypothetical protein